MMPLPLVGIEVLETMLRYRLALLVRHPRLAKVLIVVTAFDTISCVPRVEKVREGEVRECKCRSRIGEVDYTECLIQGALLQSGIISFPHAANSLIQSYVSDKFRYAYKTKRALADTEA